MWKMQNMIANKNVFCDCFQLPDDLPSEITDVFTSIGPICDAAEAIFEASQTTQSTTTTTEANS